MVGTVIMAFTHELSALAAQQSEPLLWIIDTAPFFLGAFAGVAGWRQDRVEALVADLREEIREREVAEGRAAQARALGELVREIQQVSRQLSLSAEEVSAASAQQAFGASEQAAAIAQTRATVSDVAEEARQIGVLAAQADRDTHATQARSDELAEGLQSLFRRTAEVKDLLDQVRLIAERSELLSLNAALEGLRAGEAGQGFALVAEQMQQLAGEVAGTVDDLQRLNTAIAQASDASRAALVATTTSTAQALSNNQAIRARTLRQEGSMAQVELSIGEIAEVTHQVAAISDQLQGAASRLAASVAGLDLRVGAIEVDDEVC